MDLRNRGGIRMKEHDYKVVITTHAAIKIKASSKQEAEDKARDMMKDRVLEDTTMNVVVWIPWPPITKEVSK